MVNVPPSIIIPTHSRQKLSLYVLHQIREGVVDKPSPTLALFLLFQSAVHKSAHVSRHTPSRIVFVLLTLPLVSGVPTRPGRVLFLGNAPCPFPIVLLTARLAIFMLYVCPDETAIALSTKRLRPLERRYSAFAPRTLGSGTVTFSETL